MRGSVQGCNGTCAAVIRAPALMPHHCNTSITWMNYSAPWSAQELKDYKTNSIEPSKRAIFLSYLTSLEGAMETLDFLTILTGEDVANTCAGPVNSTHCYLRSAVAEYDVTITNNIISLNDPGHPRFVHWANNTAITEQTIAKFGLRTSDDPTNIKTTLGGIVNAFLTEFAFFEGTEPPNTPGYLGTAAQTQSWFLFQHITNYEQYAKQEACSYAWKDPRPAAMAGMNELTFRTGLFTANTYNDTYLRTLLDPGLTTHHNTTGSNETPCTVFQFNPAFFAAAAALQLLTIALVASTFFGFWRLGRDVSFSPLEIAKVSGLQDHILCHH
jgi:hypothetical protein